MMMIFRQAFPVGKAPARYISIFVTFWQIPKSTFHTWGQAGQSVAGRWYLANLPILAFLLTHAAGAGAQGGIFSTIASQSSSANWRSDIPGSAPCNFAIASSGVTSIQKPADTIFEILGEISILFEVCDILQLQIVLICVGFINAHDQITGELLDTFSLTIPRPTHWISLTANIIIRPV